MDDFLQSFVERSQRELNEQKQLEAELIEQQKLENKQKLGVFDFVNAINKHSDPFTNVDGKRQIVDRKSSYSKFIINRQFSYFPDTVFVANVANIYLNDIDDVAHFDYYFNLVQKKNRFTKWAKTVVKDDVDILCRHYEISMAKAMEIIDLFDEQAINKLKERYNHGGR